MKLLSRARSQKIAFLSASKERSSDTEPEEASSSSSSYGEERELCHAQVREFCRKEGITLSRQQMIRFEHFHSFNAIATREAIKNKHDDAYLKLRMEGDLVSQFKKKMLFPLELRTKKEKAQVLYIRPSRYIPSPTGSDAFIENFCYVMNDMSQTEEQCQKGLAIIVNLIGYSSKNIHRENSKRVLQLLQGEMVPTKVALVLFVDAPKVFRQFWQMLKPLVSDALSKKVHFITSDTIGKYFDEGYQAHLPRDMASGWASSSELVEDYIDLKLFEDNQS
ncbi:unnamed protein product [Cylindrotheca closterium]|uniref:CRAL-TRIO domain-containing protein n=1 Tax=Cylindrotheca closterium TaxID=2856 RepID=A0AAD2CB82_9STRA|nr:unnamed protein product [Cylindrotheca closterium]